MQMAQVETWIRERAYAIWQQEGCPEGREQQHWEQAAREVMSRGGGSVGQSAAREASNVGQPAQKAASGKSKTTRRRRAA